ncbi:hypothetical protein TIFTF001_045359 [Ficus carica]|uniref:Uncharacterized protein n=1 Tax=Ficus carica TaxID=3494 RepID=A0AA88CHT0_FICCA|nr:hypothetical protein TIFTF001_045356 [Ficus carica]GMN20618.1 hypothetical protein TIFTF001_045357 [Ficus carica]GMN20626.1 hypothetical protein TIFTF001_045358 [Ficus carica]GMN20635.1 hypothetical protein TIFTF001_045359 [Ficus carica]
MDVHVLKKPTFRRSQLGSHSLRFTLEKPRLASKAEAKPVKTKAKIRHRRTTKPERMPRRN